MIDLILIKKNNFVIRGYNNYYEKISQKCITMILIRKDYYFNSSIIEY